MNSTRIFVCHNLDLTEETRLEVQILNQLLQKLREIHIEIVIYPGRASEEGFLTFFYRQLSTCQLFLLFQTESAISSPSVQSAVSIARMRVEQKQMKEALCFVALPDKTLNPPPNWPTLLTFGATSDYQRALEKLLLFISLGQKADARTDPVTSPPVALFEATEAAPTAPYIQPLIAPPPPGAGLENTPIPANPAYGQNQLILHEPLSPASARSPWEQTQVNRPAASLDPASMSVIDRPAKLTPRLSKGQMWLSVVLASLLILGVLLFTVVLPLHASGTHIPGTSLVQASATPGVLPTVNDTATAGSQASATASTQGTVTAQASATASAQSTASAQATISARATASAQSTASVQATASTPQGLYAVTTRNAPNVFDSLSNTSSLEWDVLNYSGGGSCGYTGGSYHAIMTQTGFFATCMAEASNYSNFLYQVHMTILSGSGGDGGGLIFRSAGNTAYRLHVGIDGSYDLVTPAKALVSGTSAAIKKGLNQTNLVAVAARNSTIDIYINGTLVVSLTDTTSSAGKIGLMGVDFSTAVNAAYSDAQIWLL